MVSRQPIWITTALIALLLVCVNCHYSMSFKNHARLQNYPSTPMELEESNLCVLGEQYIGKYTRHQSQPLFNYLESISGDIEILFFTNAFDSTRQYELNALEIFLFDPVYRDGRAVGMLISLDQINGTQWIGIDKNITMANFYKERSGEQPIIQHVNYTITLHNAENKNPKSVTVTLRIQGRGFNFSAQLLWNNALVSTLGYSLYVTGVVLLQIGAAFMMLRNMDINAHFFNKLSLTTVAICNIQDFYLTMIHIEYIMEANNSYLFFILPALAYTFLFVVFDMKLLFLVWRGHYMGDVGDPQDLRKKLTAFYIKFYVGLFVYLTLAYFFTYQGWMIIFQSLYILPQIIHNARVGNNPGFSLYYIFGYLGMRFFLPFYQRTCPENHFLLTPMPVVVLVIGLLYALMIAWLYFQHVFGSRFFIPKFLRPNYFNYACKLRMTEENSTLECTICLQGIFEDPQGHINASEINIQVDLIKQANVMRTSCNHYFHKDCLTRWIDVKMECPTCRKALPPI